MCKQVNRTSATQPDVCAWTLPPLLDAWFLTGPTAAGKTAVAIELAGLLDAEIISMDSMAIYRHMDIGTAKPHADERSAVPHHLIDIIEPTEEYSLGAFVQAAHAVADDIRRRGKQVLVVGGTPLYLKGLLRGVFVGPPPDPQFRQAIEEEVLSCGLAPLQERLARIDPLSAHRIGSGDLRRMIRALEVARATGKPLSHFQVQFDEPSPGRESRVFALGWERATLHQRVERRIDAMLDAGLVGEVEMLLSRYSQLSRTAAQAVGYKEPMAYLQGELDYAQMRDQILFHTRQFVRRQEIWFRSLPELTRLAIDESRSPRSIAESIAA